MTAEWKVLIILFLGFTSLPWTVKAAWDYMILKVDFTSSNTELVYSSLRTERITRGVYGMSGNVTMNTLVDNRYTFEIKVYRSALANSNFVLSPYRIMPMPFHTFMSTIYKQFAMNSLKDCSNLPVFKGRFKGLPPEIVFHLDKCLLSSTAFPPFIRPGFYKVSFQLKGPLVEVVQEMIVNVFESVGKPD